MGYENDAVRVSGVVSQGGSEVLASGRVGSCSEKENGVYLRQSEDLNGRPYYTMQGLDYVRHLFYEPHINSGSWAVCPVPDTSNGVFIQSNGSTSAEGNLLARAWQRIPPDVKEAPTFQMNNDADGVYWAASCGHAEALVALLRSPAPFKANASGAGGEGDLTPLQIAEQEGHTECANILQKFTNKPTKSASKRQKRASW
jgi:hypothetical protein